MFVKRLSVVAAALLASCSLSSNWHLVHSGYSVERVNDRDLAFEVHRNQLKQLGGDVNSARFRHYVAEQLKAHELCPKGWTPLPCVKDGSCIQQTSRSITVLGRCTGEI